MGRRNPSCPCGDCIDNCDLIDNCECIQGNYGNVKSIVRVDVTLSGSPKTVYRSCVSTGTTTGADWTGTFSVNCGTPASNYQPSTLWAAETFVGTDTFNDFYVREGLFVQWRAGYDSGGVVNNEYFVQIAFNSTLKQYSVGLGPECPTITANCGTQGLPFGNVSRVAEYGLLSEAQCSPTQRKFKCEGVLPQTSNANGAGGTSCYSEWCVSGYTIDSVEVITA